MIETYRLKNARRATTLVEVIVALFVLSVALAAVTQVTVLAGQQRRAAQRRQLAILEVANLMERVAALSYDETRPDMADRLALSVSIQQTLPQAELQIDVSEESGPEERVAAKRVTIQISWVNSAAQRVEPVRLVAWKHNPSLLDRGEP